MKFKLIEIVEKISDGNGNNNLLIECNEYDENNKRTQQLSRSPFVFPETMTDQEILDKVKLEDYSIYY